MSGRLTGIVRYAILFVFITVAASAILIFANTYHGDTNNDSYICYDTTGYICYDAPGYIGYYGADADEGILQQSAYGYPHNQTPQPYLSTYEYGYGNMGEAPSYNYQNQYQDYITQAPYSPYDCDGCCDNGYRQGDEGSPLYYYEFCPCHGVYARRYFGTPDPAGGYMGIAPFSVVPPAPPPTPPVVDYPTIVTSVAQLQGIINGITAGTGNAYRIRVNFTGNTYTTTAGSTISVSGNRHIILDSATAVNQVWYRNQASGRHFTVTGGARFELRNITLSRSAAWRATGTNAMLNSG